MSRPRRDNLAAAIHMVVEAIFWFHPLVWWIGARLVEERERACDEEVLRLGNEPTVYHYGKRLLVKRHSTRIAGSTTCHEIPNVQRITACLLRNFDRLSPDCAAVFAEEQPMRRR